MAAGTGAAGAQGASLNMNGKGLSSPFKVSKSSFEVQRYNEREADSMCAVLLIKIAAV